VEVDIEAMDRRVKWWLLGVSLGTLALLILAALAENVYPQWRLTRKAYAKILEQRATDGRGKMIADQFKIDLVGRLFGQDVVKRIRNAEDPAAIVTSWARTESMWRTLRAKYLLYR